MKERTKRYSLLQTKNSNLRASVYNFIVWIIKCNHNGTSQKQVTNWNSLLYWSKLIISRSQLESMKCNMFVDLFAYWFEWIDHRLVILIFHNSFTKLVDAGISYMAVTLMSCARIKSQELTWVTFHRREMRFAGCHVPYSSFIQFFRDQPKPMF